LIVPGRTSGSSGITRKIRLYEEDTQASQRLSGNRSYQARFTVWATAANKKTYQYQYRLFIGPDDPANLAKYCTEKDGLWSRRLVLRQRPRARTDEREVKRDGLLFESRGPEPPIPETRQSEDNLANEPGQLSRHPGGAQPSQEPGPRS
jgi:hypothetical protein